MQNNFSVTPALREDFDCILAIGQNAIDQNWTLSFLLSDFERNDVFFAVAKSCDNVLGFVVFRSVGDDGEILQLATEQNSRRHGIAHALIAYTVETAKKMSFQRIFLEVRLSNLPAVSLYEKFGFTSIHVRKGYYCDPTEDALIMEKVL